MRARHFANNEGLSCRLGLWKWFTACVYEADDPDHLQVRSEEQSQRRLFFILSLRHHDFTTTRGRWQVPPQ
jgi:hypothetical protein